MSWDEEFSCEPRADPAAPDATFVLVMIGTLRVAVAQIAPVLLDREGTLAKVVARVDEAAARGCALVAFGEALVPGYPVWLERTDAARFEAADQKELHARYLEQAVDLDAGHLDGVADAARRGRITVVLGVVERAADRGGHSAFCTALVVGPEGRIRVRHRKLVPTHEERLTWAAGDGHGLCVVGLGAFRLGVLNCWENWMPLARAALQAQGEDLHVGLWPGRVRNTVDVARFAAREGRSYVLAASGVLRGADVPADAPSRERFVQGRDEVILDGGSAIAGPDGGWIVSPVGGGRETLLVAELSYARLLGERQSFDPAGHYARPDVLRLAVDRRRLRAAEIEDGAT